MKDPCHTEHTKDYKARQKGCRYNGQQVDNAVKGDQKTKSCTAEGHFRVEISGSPDAENIFHTEDGDGDHFDDAKPCRQKCQLFKGLHEGDNDIGKNCHGDKDIKKTADLIAPVADLYDVK